MDISSLETFVWVVRLGGVGAAAERLNLSQPAITRRISELERELGAKLFLRQGRGVVLSPVGRTCLERAKLILSEVGELRIAVGGEGSVGGTVRVGVGEVAALSWLHRLLTRIEEIYPNLHLELDVDLSHCLLMKLASSEIELAMLPGPVSIPGAVAMKLGEYSLEWMASPYLIKDLNCFSAAELVEFPILTLTAEARANIIMERWFQSANVKPKRIHYCNSLSVIASLVRSGFGISLLPVHLFRDSVSSKTMVALRCEPTVDPVDYWVAYLQNPERPLLDRIAALTRDESIRCLKQPGEPISKSV